MAKKEDVRLLLEGIEEIITPNNPVDKYGKATAGRANKGKRVKILILKDVKE